jgi:hypothetical protein
MLELHYLFRMEYIKRKLMEIQLEQDGHTKLEIDTELDIDNLDWSKFHGLWSC